MNWSRDTDGRRRRRTRESWDDAPPDMGFPPRAVGRESPAGPPRRPVADAIAVDRSNVSATVKWFNATKGFGFVTLAEGGPDAFLHVSALQRAGLSEVPEGTTLMCDIGRGQRGPQVVAVNEVDTSTAIADTRPPRRDFGDRPPRRDFGAPGGFGDRPPRRDFGAPGGFGDRPPRRDFGDRGGFGAPRSFGDRPPRRDFGGGRDEGGPTYAVNGTVKWFDQVRGFGFVTPDDGGQDVFLHSSVLQRAGKHDVQQGEKVNLEVRDGQRGRQAVVLKGG